LNVVHSKYSATLVLQTPTSVSILSVFTLSISRRNKFTKDFKSVFTNLMDYTKYDPMLLLSFCCCYHFVMMMVFLMFFLDIQKTLKKSVLNPHNFYMSKN